MEEKKKKKRLIAIIPFFFQNFQMKSPEMYSTTMDLGLMLSSQYSTAIFQASKHNLLLWSHLRMDWTNHSDKRCWEPIVSACWRTCLNHSFPSITRTVTVHWHSGKASRKLFTYEWCFMLQIFLKSAYVNYWGYNWWLFFRNCNHQVIKLWQINT